MTVQMLHNLRSCVLIDPFQVENMTKMHLLCTCHSIGLVVSPGTMQLAESCGLLLLHSVTREDWSYIARLGKHQNSKYKVEFFWINVTFTPLYRWKNINHYKSGTICTWKTMTTQHLITFMYFCDLFIFLVFSSENTNKLTCSHTYPVFLFK
jgi:hypothetical protein